MKTHTHSRRAFTLIEIVVSLGIIAAALAVYTVAVYSIFLTTDAKHQEVAVRIAENELENLRSLGYDSLPSSGSFSDALLSSLAANGAGTITVSDYNAKTKQATVTVTWTETSKGNRSISLSTLITKTGGL